MKTNYVVIAIFIIIIIMVFWFKQNIKPEKNTNEIKSESNFIYGKNYKITSVKDKKKKEYQTMPANLDGYKVIGKLEIPAINLTTYVLEKTTDETLNISVTKLSGPKINEIGNFCIIGHNYLNSKMFFKLNKVKIDDEIILTNTFDESVKYKVYEIKQVLPDEVNVLSQDTNAEREVTLITCTFGAAKRIIVKAVEIYD